MAKAIAVVTSVVAEISGSITIRVHYTVSIDNGVNFGSDAVMNPALAPATILANARTKIVADCLNQGVTLLTTDVLIFGGPA